MDIVEEKKARLKELFPGVFTETTNSEGKINESLDFEKLKAELGTFSDLFESRRERYGMDWPGKKDALKLIQTTTNATLKPCREESVDFDNTENIYIEGDNLEVLKLLQKSYYGKVKMIYIDPPYNTGNEFIYPDNYSESLETYLQYAGLIDNEGKKFSTNTTSEGRFHTKWLSMMYPRLYLAKNLLKEDGLIFISIDDNEVMNLKKICDEIFGEENFINLISVKAKPSSGASGGGEDKKLKKNVEYLVCFTKNREKFDQFNDIFETTELMSYIENYKSEGKSWKYTRVLYSLGDKVHFTDTVDGSGESIKIFKHNNVEIKTISDLAIEEKISEAKVYFKYFEKVFRDTNAQSSIRQRVIDCTDNEDTFYSIEYVPRSGRNKSKLTTLYYKGKNKDLIAWLYDVAEKNGNNLIKKDTIGTLWSNFNWNNVSKEGDIQYPNGKKPISFIKRMIEMISSDSKDDIILDFFAGSGSTAHAVIDMNLIDNGLRKSISVQLPEIISEKDKKKSYSGDEFKHINTVSDVFKTRLKRAIDKYKTEIEIEDENKKGKLNFEQNNNTIIDLGFKVFKLDKSNFKQWQKLSPESSLEKITEQLELHIFNIDQKATPEDLLYEILLKSGFTLTEKITSKIITGKTVYSINDGSLLLCLENSVSRELMDEVIKEKPMQFICLDSAFDGNDQLKANVVQTFIAYNMEKEKHNQIMFKTV